MKTLTYTEAEKELIISFDTLREKQFPIDFLEQYSHTFDRFQWQQVSKYQNLSENFIEKHKHKLYWEIVSKYQHLSQEFIEKYRDVVFWSSISVHKKLSQEFIEKHHDLVDWYRVSQYQNLSWDFIVKHLDQLDKNALLKNKNFDQKTKELLQTTLKLSS
jgi:hypothetical protein